MAAGIPEYSITQEQIDQYRRDGYIQVDNVIPGNVIEEMRTTIADAVAVETAKGNSDKSGDRMLSTYEKIFNQKINLWRNYPTVAEYTLSNSLGKIAQQLEGRRMRVWHDQALFKEPQKGNNRTPWHQDAVYWPHIDKWRQTTIWIALRDATPENGCMAFVNGTHSLGAMPAVDLSDPDDLFSHASHIRPIKPVPRPLKAGSATFHNGLTFHYAGPNKTQGTREAFAVIYMPEDTRFDGSDHIVTDRQNFTAGDVLDGELFPLVG